MKSLLPAKCQKAFSKQFKKLRADNKMTLTALAKALHTSTATISNIEKGVKGPSAALLKRICLYFDRVPAQFGIKSNMKGWEDTVRGDLMEKIKTYEIADLLALEKMSLAIEEGSIVDF